MLLNDVGPLLTAGKFQLSLCEGCHPVYFLEVIENATYATEGY